MLPSIKVLAKFVNIHCHIQERIEIYIIVQ
jgi:hypothetical protein